MKQLNTYIVEKLRINKDIQTPENNLNKVFKDIYELVEVLNGYFEGDLKKPIKVSENEVCFRPISMNSRDGIHVKEHFYIYLNSTKTVLRFGYKKEYGLMVQEIYKDFRDRNSYGTLRKFDGYKFGEDNFLEWLTHPKEMYKKTLKPILKIFKLDENS